MIHDHPKYPNTPGSKGSAGTSREAADAIAPKLGRLQALVLGAIKSTGNDGLTADETATRLGMQRWSCQPRTSELQARGLIVDSGKRRKNETGKNAIVWVVAERQGDLFGGEA